MNLLNIINKVEGIVVEQVLEDKIVTMDEIKLRAIDFRMPDKINLEELVEFNSLKVNSKRFFNILNKIDKEYFMNIEQIEFISNEEEYLEYVKYFDWFLDLENTVGIYLFQENYLFINIYAIRKLTEELDGLNIGMWTTLLHELRHSYQLNPLFEYVFSNNIEEKEKDAEEFARRTFDRLIKAENYQVIES